MVLEPRPQLEELDVGMVDIFKMGADLGLISNEEVSRATPHLEDIRHHIMLEHRPHPTVATAMRMHFEPRGVGVAECVFGCVPTGQERLSLG